LINNYIQTGQSTYYQIIKTFGDEYLIAGKDSAIDRKKLGGLIFSDRDARKKLDKITHSAIFYQLFKKIVWHFLTGTQNLIIDSPLLFETGFNKFMRMNIVIYVDYTTQLQRLLIRDTTLTEERAKERINAQIPLDEKVKKATVVIDNNGTIANTKSQVQQIIKKYRMAQYSFFSLRNLIILSLLTISIYFTCGDTIKSFLFRR